jgi:hypothetical protein
VSRQTRRVVSDTRQRQWVPHICPLLADVGSNKSLQIRCPISARSWPDVDSHESRPANSNPQLSVCIGMEMQLAKLIGRKIVVLGPKLLDGAKGQDKLETVTLVGVDQAGIWIESEEAANRIADKFRVKPATRSAFFIPFAQIVTILANNEATGSGETTPAIDEKAA